MQKKKAYGCFHVGSRRSGRGLLGGDGFEGIGSSDRSLLTGRGRGTRCVCVGGGGGGWRQHLPLQIRGEGQNRN